MITNYKKINNILGWAVFAIATAVYLMTMEPTVSLWDCGEFIASGYKLQPGHPPGAPLFLMLARFFSLFASSTEDVAMMVNAMSAICSSLTILFLFWSITHLGRKLFPSGKDSLPNTIAVLGSGVVGALAYTFSDTFWFSAVEGEVYAMSSLFTALVFWGILKWEDDDDASGGKISSMRWVVFIALLMGLSIGVHLLNLLAIPAIVFVYYFKKYEVTPLGLIAAALISILSIAFVMYGIIQGSVKMASWFELFFVNGLGMGFDSGFLIYLLVLLGLFIAGIYYSMQPNKVILNTVLGTAALTLVGIPFLGSAYLAILIIAGIAVGISLTVEKYPNILNTILLLVTVIMIGYSSYAMIVIRSKANPPMDENNPENAFTFLSYLNREQYGDRPLFFGEYYSAPIDYKNPMGEKKMSYIKNTKKDPRTGEIESKYNHVELGQEYNYHPKFQTIFPRMYSSNRNHVQAYQQWGDVEGKKYRVRHANGERGSEVCPTFGENLRFFFSYQINHMYMRYFMWNFVGRQNDEQGHGDFMNGNWLSGINFIDEMRLGDQSQITDAAKNHPSRNVYYGLPLILGLIGMVFTLMVSKRQFTVIGLLFFFTGFAIVIYLNQTPYQPRERDYAYAGSFYAFAIWIGLAVAGLYKAFSEFMPKVPASTFAFALCAGVPVLMAVQNWDDHDRSGRYLARDLAHNYLETCKPNALIFTNGDNDTFPLWYAQEVEGVRTDVRVVCLPLLSTDWYIEQMQRRAYQSAPLPINMRKDQYVQGTRDYAPIERSKEVSGHYDVSVLMDFILDDGHKIQRGGSMMNYCPTNLFKMRVDPAQVVKNEAVYPDEVSKIEKELRFSTSSSYLLKNELAIMDILADYDWSRPMYFTSLQTKEALGLDKYLRNEGFAYRLTPLYEKKERDESMIDTEKMYENLMHKFKWGRMNAEDVRLDHFQLRTLKVIRVRSLFSDLAFELIKKGEKVKAIEVLDRCIELMPFDKVPYDYQVLGLIDGYYKTGETEKANALAKEYAMFVVDEMEYYNSLDEDRYAVIANDHYRSNLIANSILRFVSDNGQVELLEELNKFVEANAVKQVPRM